MWLARADALRRWRGDGDDGRLRHGTPFELVRLVFALACAASSLYGWLAGTWPFGVVEGVWAILALRRWRRKGDHATAR